MTNNTPQPNIEKTCTDVGCAATGTDDLCLRCGSPMKAGHFVFVEDRPNIEDEELRKKLAELLVENHMPTRQLFLSKAVQLFRQYAAKREVEARKAELKYLLEDFGVEDNVDPIKERLAQLNPHKEVE